MRFHLRGGTIIPLNVLSDAYPMPLEWYPNHNLRLTYRA